MAAVVGAAIPTIVTAFAEGVPGYRHVLGFVVAGIGVWLISRSEGEAGRPEGLGMAVLAGVGFAGFYLCIHQAGNASALWVAACSRSLRCWSPQRSFYSEDTCARCPRRCWAWPWLPEFSTSPAPPSSFAHRQIGRLDDAVVLSSLYPAVTVVLARIFLHEHFSRARTIGMVAALAAVPMIAG